MCVKFVALLRPDDWARMLLLLTRNVCGAVGKRKGAYYNRLEKGGGGKLIIIFTRRRRRGFSFLFLLPRMYGMYYMCMHRGRARESGKRERDAHFSLCSGGQILYTRGREVRG